MTPEERFARLEKNHDILTQLLIETKALTERAQAQTERLQSQTETLQSQTKSLQFQTGILIELARDHDERLETHLKWINQLGEAQANTDFKIDALADAQIKADERMARFESALARSDAKIAALADSHLRLEGAHIRTEESLTRLAEAQAYSDQRFNEFIHFFQKRRDDET